jgi:CHAT domain-containing protein
MRKVALLQKSLADPKGTFDATTARELFLYLVQPVIGRLSGKRLVIVAHEDLATIPFQALLNPSDGRYLGERLQISYTPSASVLLGMRPSQGILGGRLLAIADSSIQTAAEEVRGIAKLFPNRSKVSIDPLASKAQVESWIGEADVVHLAVHGKFVAGEPLLSYLALAPTGEHNGQLTAAEMFGLRLDNSRLVVLSACETGRSEATHGNEIVGMVRALLYAGAGTLLVSSWEVNSAATTLWMQAFYEAAQSKPLGEAARMALLRVKAQPEYGHPYYWAAFTMIGR